MDPFRRKRGLPGQLLESLLRQTKTTEPTDVRCLCLQGLPVILGDDPSFFKNSSDPADKDLYSQTAVGILSIGDENPQFNPANVGIILEGNVVMEELSNHPQDFCVLFGLIYALHLDYPKYLKNTYLCPAGDAQLGEWWDATQNSNSEKSALLVKVDSKIF